MGFVFCGVWKYVVHVEWNSKKTRPCYHICFFIYNCISFLRNREGSNNCLLLKLYRHELIKMLLTASEGNRTHNFLISAVSKALCHLSPSRLESDRRWSRRSLSESRIDCGRRPHCSCMVRLTFFDFSIEFFIRNKDDEWLMMRQSSINAPLFTKDCMVIWQNILLTDSTKNKLWYSQ